MTVEDSDMATLTMGATPDTVWALLQEVGRKQEENAIQMRETERFMKEQSAEADKRHQETERFMKERSAETERFMKEQSAEADKRHQETERFMKERSAEADKRHQETERLLKERSAEADKRHQETERLLKEQSAETDKKFQDLNKQMGGLHNSFGELAAHLVAPNIAQKFNALGYHFDSIAPGGKKIFDDRGNQLAQIDLLLENGEYAVAVEVKSRPKESHITDHIIRLGILRAYMDKHHDSRVIRGALAGAVFYDWIKEAAVEAGLYVIVQTGDTMQIETPEGFTPREW
jgi:hypothetical protein